VEEFHSASDAAFDQHGVAELIGFTSLNLLVRFMMKHNVSSNWLQECSLNDSLAILTDLARHHARSSGRFSSDILQMLDRQDYLALVSYELDYRPDDLPLDLVNARQALGFFQKLEPLDLGFSKESVAYTKFIQSEAQCKETNARFKDSRDLGFAFPSVPVACVIDHASRKISSILGPVPSLEHLDFSFGPGANTTVNARASSPRFKLGSKLVCSPELANSVQCLLQECPEWSKIHSTEDSEHVWIVPVEIGYGKLQFVPKNAKTYRSIVVEPILNSFAQKGIGAYLRDRLRFAGVDLSDQSRNQRLACIGSVDDSLSTLDLSSASDTIAKSIVDLLLPYEWYSFLSRFRTGSVTYRGETIVLEKFSSMGNAFTFELESLIFWGLAYGVMRFLSLPLDKVAVYGDDIIVPTKAFQLLAEVLSYCGFTLNESKSFSSGPFRESCGADWFRGFDIRPFYQKTLVSGRTLFTLHNFYMRRFEFAEARKVLKMIPLSLRLFGPDGYGDGHLIGSHARRTKPSLQKRGWEGSLFDTFTLKKREISRERLLPGDQVLPVYSIYVTNSDESERTNHYVVRGHRGYRRISIYTLKTGIYI